jgi:Uma2 family endonuclease
MAELAIRKMTVAEFLRWEDGTDTRYELLAGTPVAMAPPAVAHGMLALRVGARIETALRARPGCILSPGTALYDRQTKVADYRRIASVQEILRIDSASVFAEILRRSGEEWITELIQEPEATLKSASIGLAVTISDLNEGIDVPETAPHPAALPARGERE